MNSDLLMTGISLGMPVAIGTGHWIRAQAGARLRARRAEHDRLTDWLPELDNTGARPVLIRREDTGAWLYLGEVTGEPGRHRAESELTNRVHIG